MFYFAPAFATNRRFFNASERTSLPKVSILYGHQDMDVGLLEAAVASGAEGIVVACTGDGTLPATWIESAATLTRSGIPVVRSSRTGQSFVAPAKGVVTSGQYNPQKARILLQLILSEHERAESDLVQGFFDS
jgi:L-asparaginase